MWPVGIFLLCASIVLRVISYPVITSDYTYFLKEWFNALSTPGLSAFTSPFADYAPLYLYLIKFLTLFPVSSLYSIKTLSVVFDVGITALTCLILYMLGITDRARLFLSFAIVFITPTFLVNSALWGQSDSPYAFFVLLSFYFLLRDKPSFATLSFSVALCLKVQAIFFLPILAGYLFRRREDLPYIVLVPIVFLASILPAWVAGGSFSYWFMIYAKQSGEYTSLSVSAQSLLSYAQALYFPGPVQNALFWISIIASLLAALYIFVLVARAGLSGPERMMLLTLLCVALLPYLLPRMHERYFYLADVFAVLFALWRPRAWYIAVLVVLSSLLSYQPFLSQLSFVKALPYVDLRMPATILLFAIIFIVAEVRRTPEIEHEDARFSLP